MGAVVLLCVCLGRAAAAVKEVREPPTITEPDRETTHYVIAKKDITLTCKATGQPAPRYRWKKDDQILNEISDKILIDELTGVLTIKNFKSEDDDGKYRCVAETTYRNPGQQDITARSLSPVQEVLMNNLEKGPGGPPGGHIVEGNEHSPFSLYCLSIAKEVAQHVTKNWYSSESKQIPLQDYNGRLHEDQNGTLHFIYLETSDTNDENDQYYRCSLSSVAADMVQLLDTHKLTVKPQSSPGGATKPTILYSSKEQYQLHQDAVLECVFGGYDSNNPGDNYMPTIGWLGKGGETLDITSGRYKFEKNMRVLKVKSVTEDDEGIYTCTGRTSAGELSVKVNLDVISKPIFDSIETRPHTETVYERKDAVFNCDARSTKGENDPQPPQWYLNGVATGTHTDVTKYKISPDKKRLEVKNVDKATDILCVQCSVENDYGTSWGDGCLTVILQTVVTDRPEKTQEIIRGDIINLGVTFTNDPAYDSTMKVEWKFKNQTYGQFDIPHATRQEQKLFINTSELTESEYNSVAGLYNLTIAHQYQTVIVETWVELVDPIPTNAPVVVESAGFPMWIIIVIVAVVVFLIILVIILYCCCNKQEGDYNVDKKEVGAGLDPKKELMEKGFDDYSRPNLNDYEDVPRQALPYDEDVPLTGDDQKSLGEYSDEDEARLGFNEDGSFIGQYLKKDPNQMPNSYDNTHSQSIV